jgi:hypothetical protein
MMRKRVTSTIKKLRAGVGGSALELASLVAIVAGVCVLVGGGWGMIAGGVAGLLVARGLAS